MGRASDPAPFPAINLMTDRERIRGRDRPAVRARFWVALAGSVILLIMVMGIRLWPTLLAEMLSR